MNLGQKQKVIPIIAPVDTGSTTVNSDVLFLKHFHSAMALISFGAITGDVVAVTVEKCADAVPSASAAIPFKYRKSAAVNADSMGAVTDATVTGVEMSASDDNKCLLIEVDGSQLNDDYPAFRVVVDPGSSASSVVVSGVAVMEPRYAGDNQPSAVA
jgi:hypothetical protein